MYKRSYEDYTAKKIRFMFSPKRNFVGLSPNFYIHVSVSDLYIPSIFLQQNRQTDHKDTVYM